VLKLSTGIWILAAIPELFRWNHQPEAHVLIAATAHMTPRIDEWIILQPKSNVHFLRQDNETDGRPFVPCDPLARPTESELELFTFANGEDSCA